MRFVLAVFLLLGLSVPQTSWAQSLNNAMWGSVSAGHRKATKTVNRQLFAPAPSASQSAEPADLTYRYNRERTQQNLRNFVERTPVDAGRSDLEQMVFSDPRFMDGVRQGVAAYGFDPDNVADMYAIWMVNAWLVANKRDEDPDAGTLAVVKSQIRVALASTPDFAKTSDADRQEYAEALALQAGMLSEAFEQRKNDTAQLEDLAAAARQGAMASGIDLSKITLTRNGFVPRKGADASDAQGSAEKASLAVATKVGSGDEGADSSYIEVALAAGAGLGIVLLAGGAILRKG